MSLFGKVLAVLNLAALGGFLYVAVLDYHMRQDWLYAHLRWDLALDGLPVDAEDADTRGKPKHRNLNAKLCKELTGSEAISTQDAYLEQRRGEIQKRIDGSEMKGTKLEKLAVVLAALMDTSEEREAILRCLPPTLEKDAEATFKDGLFQVLASRAEVYKKAPSLNDPKDQIQARLKAVESTLGGEIKSKEDYARLRKGFQERDAVSQGQQFLDGTFNDVATMPSGDGKRDAIARTLVRLIEALPTDEEKKRRAEDRTKKPEERADPSSDPAYRQALNVVGVRRMARALDREAAALLAMATAVGSQRVQERYLFAAQHQARVNELQRREHDLQEAKDKLAVALAQAKTMEEKAEQQEAVVKEREADLAKARDVTSGTPASAYEKLVREQEKLYQVRLRLRDANRLNQATEAKIRRLETLIIADDDK